MNFDEQLYLRIQRYLDAEMDAAEAAAFEAEINANPELAREVQLNVEMEQLLAATEENELRKNLQQLSAEFAAKNTDEDDERGGGYWHWLLLLMPFLLIGGWWFSRSEVVDNQIVKKGEGNAIATEIPPVINADSANLTTNPSIIDSSAVIQKKSTAEPPISPTTPTVVPPIIDKKNQSPPRENLRLERAPTPIDTTVERDTTKIYVEDTNFPDVEPAEYATIPSEITYTTDRLDLLLQENTNRNRIQLTNVELPDINIDTSYIRKAIDSVTFKFSGELIAATDFQPTNLRYQVFDYDQSYLGGAAIFSGTLPLQPLDDAAYSFSIEKKLALGKDIPAITPQPYYVVIQSANSSDVLWVEQFSVVNFAMLSPMMIQFDEGVVGFTPSNYSFNKTILRVPTTVTHQSPDSIIILPLTGKLILDSRINDTLISLIQYEVYSFDQEGYEPLYVNPLPLIPIGGEEHLFMTRDRLKLPAGNYYILIKDDRNFTYGLEKFRVVE